jgi:hypothetical protein
MNGSPSGPLNASAFYDALGTLTRETPDGTILIPDALEDYALITALPTFCWHAGRTVQTVTYRGGFEGCADLPSGLEVVEGGEAHQRFYCWVVADLTQAENVENSILTYLGYLADGRYAAFALPANYTFSAEFTEKLARERIAINGIAPIAGGAAQAALLRHQEEEMLASRAELDAANTVYVGERWMNRTKAVQSSGIVTLRNKHWICAGGFCNQLELYRVVPWDQVERPLTRRSYAGVVFRVASSERLWTVTGERIKAIYDPGLDRPGPPEQMTLF